MNLVISIRGRDAIPVRALPYVTGWSLSPDAVAAELAESSELQRLTGLRAYYDDGNLIELLPKEWDRIVADMEALRADLDASGEVGAARYAAWRQRSIPCLPAGVFGLSCRVSSLGLMIRRLQPTLIQRLISWWIPNLNLGRRTYRPNWIGVFFRVITIPA